MPSLSELGLNLAEVLGIKKKKSEKEAKKAAPKIEPSVGKKTIHGFYHENIEVEVDEEGRVVHATPDNTNGYFYAPPRHRGNSNK